MLPTQILVQTAHAALEVGRCKLINEYEEHPSLIVCGVKNENELIAFKQKLIEKNVKFKEFYEPDLNNSLTAIATEATDSIQRKVFSQLPLIKLKDLEGGYRGCK